jgi:carboxymethylenebutenolidase
MATRSRCGKAEQAWIQLYDAYTHEHLDRRRFIDRMVQVTGGTAAATAAIAILENNYAKAAIVPPDDARLTTDQATFQGATGEVSGYLAMPAEATGPLPAIIVIHENRGLNPHIEDVTRRAALEGFVAFAPDFLSPLGGTPADEDQARELIGQLDAAETVANAVAAVRFLEAHEATAGAVGVTGFCWGGALTNATAVAVPDLGAAVAWYGRQPDAADAAKIQAPLMLHYAGLDERINAGIDAYTAALDAAGVTYTVYIYDGVNHAFNNDTNEARYDEAAANLAWQRTIDFFKAELGG